jgi:glycine dehydrogenase subunit 1
VAAFLEGLGAAGLATLAGLRFQYARFLHSALSQITGFQPAFPAKVPFFDEFVFRTPLPAEEIVAELEEQGICAGIPVRLPAPAKGSGLLLSVTERRTLREMEYFLKALKQLRDRNAGRILGADL